MQLADAQWARIAPLTPTPRGNRKLASRQALEGWRFITKEGCSGRAPPERYGRWRAVYMRGRRWIDKGVLERVFAEPQRDELEAQREPERPLRARLDSAIVKLHQDGTGAPRNRGAKRSAARAEA